MPRNIYLIGTKEDKSSDIYSSRIIVSLHRNKKVGKVVLKNAEKYPYLKKYVEKYNFILEEIENDDIDYIVSKLKEKLTEINSVFITGNKNASELEKILENEKELKLKSVYIQK